MARASCLVICSEALINFTDYLGRAMPLPVQAGVVECTWANFQAGKILGKFLSSAILNGGSAAPARSVFG